METAQHAVRVTRVWIFTGKMIRTWLHNRCAPSSKLLTNLTKHWKACGSDTDTQWVLLLDYTIKVLKSGLGCWILRQQGSDRYVFYCPILLMIRNWYRFSVSKWQVMNVTTVFKVLNLSKFLLYSESLYSISIFKAFKLKYFLLKRKKMDRWKYFHFLLILYFLSYILFDNHSYFAGCSDDALMLSDKPWSFDLKLRLKEQYQSRDCCLVPQAALHSVYLCTM